MKKMKEMKEMIREGFNRVKTSRQQDCHYVRIIVIVGITVTVSIQKHYSSRQRRKYAHTYARKKSQKQQRHQGGKYKESYQHPLKISLYTLKLQMN